MFVESMKGLGKTDVKHVITSGSDILAAKETSRGLPPSRIAEV